ncbi:MAG: hypothetical protein BMS9Abin29_0595 [Gemmatimonadota bacterium]|nr:MAG: hypothetical protein BMS9Abin29_0595 [Gemmatimonadota bacterium]
MSHRGTSAVEALLALSLGAGILLSAFGLLSAQRRSANRLLARADGLLARRVTRIVLGEELRRGAEGRDWWAPGGDSVRLRVFRGLAFMCPSGLPNRVLARYRGSRLPDSRKDSVLVLGANGRWQAVDLIARARTPLTCPDAPFETVELWTLNPPASGAVVARVFETGSYHLSGGAFRYRRGRGGRQPLTPNVLVAERSHLGPGLTGGLALELATETPAPGESDGPRTLWPRERARE